MKKKVIALLLAAVVMAGGLTGCGASPKYNNTGSAEGAAAPETTEAENSTAAEAAPDAADGSYQKSYQESIYDYETDTQEMPTPRYPGTEEYTQVPESGFASVMKEPLSTFSADVDTASYSNLRRMIQDGYRISDIPAGSVRIEELLNYFSYDYKNPDRDEPFGVTTAIAACPWNSETELLMIGLKTEAIDYADAPPSNLVFLLDVSGSMNDPDKLPLLQEAFSLLTENLTEKDRVSIVTYAGSDAVILDGVKGSKQSLIVDALQNLQAGGSTYGSKGIQTAYELAEENYIKGGNNRVILATDGDLNVGLTSVDELEKLISEKKESGVYLSVLGFGTGNIKDNKMETLADKGNGNYAYIDSLKEANKVLVEEMGATLLTVCKDVKFQVEFNPAVVQEYRLIGYENRLMAKEAFNDDTKDAGEVGAGHSVTVLYEIKLCEPLSGLSTKEVNDLKYSDSYKEKQGGEADSTALSEEWLTLSVRYKKPAEDTSRLLEYPVDYRSYSGTPGQDWKFAAAVAEFGLLVTDSENKQDADLKHVEAELKAMNLKDEYKQEFYELVKQIGK